MQTAPYPQPIGAIFTADSLYNMPLFQRPYAWTVKKHLSDYKDDLESLMDVGTNPNEDLKLFLGAIIIQESASEYTSTESKEFDVIDGQQRLTTIYLTLLALCHHAFENGYEESITNIKNKFLLSQGFSTKRYPKITPTSMDTMQLKKIFSFIPSIDPVIPSPRGPEKGKLLSAYNFIKKEIVDKSISSWVKDYEKTEKEAFELFQSLFTDKVIMADITLSERNHDAFEVFDRLNTKGARLSTLDLIRNEVFRGFPKNSQESEKFYENHFRGLENKIDNISNNPKEEARDKIKQAFFPAYGKCISGKIKKATIVKELVTNWIKMFPKGKSFDPVQAVNHMSKYVELYKILVTGDIPEWITNKKLRVAIENLYELEIFKTCYPFIMSCLYAHRDTELSSSDAADCLVILESFAVRRIYAEQDEGTGMAKNMDPLWESTKGDPSLVVEKISSRTKFFPSDNKFKDGICYSSLYGKKSEKFFLLAYEKDLTKNLPELIYNKIKIESTDHILPQSWKGTGGSIKNPDWKDVNEKESFEKLRHTWGNLLPMSVRLNSIKSNKSFSEFKSDLQIMSRFETTAEWNKEVAENDDWTLSDIEKRNSKISKWAINRWPFYKSRYS